MKKTKQIIALLITIILVYGLCGPGTYIKNYAEDKSEKEDYTEKLEQMVSLYEIEENTIVIDTNNNNVKINGNDVELSEEFNMNEIQEEKILSSTDVALEMLNDYGYEITDECNGIIEAENVFSSGRLYVNNSYVSDNYGAVMEVNGEHTVLQYSSPEEAAVAYKNLKEDGYDILPSLTITLESIEEYEIELESNKNYLDNGITYHGLNKMIEDDLYKQRDVTVAIIDSGINDYYNRDIVSYNLTSSIQERDVYGHGTMVYSVMANSTSDNVKYISIKAFDDNGNADFATMEAAVLKAKELGVDVLNMSIGMYDVNFETKYGTMDIWNDVFFEMQNEGTVICVSAGNQNVDTDYVYPAGSPYTWSVAAIDINGNKAPTSNYGDIDFSAKGVGVVVTNASGGISSVSGTSFASPYIASMAANYKGESDYSVTEIYQKIIEESLDLGDAGKDEIYGYGVPCYNYVKGEFEYCYHQNIEIITKEPNCTEEGKTYKVCTDCGNVFYETNIKEALGHSYIKEKIKATCQAKGKNTYTCEVCGDSYEEVTPYDYENHINVEERILSEPTCYKKGVAQKFCIDCDVSVGYSYDIEKTEHQWIVTDIIEGDCTEKGYVNKKCEVCEEKTIVETDNGTIHNNEYLEEKTIKEPTCDECGKVEVWCNHCDVLVETKVIEKTVHKYEVIETKGTCSLKGYNTYKCENCNDSYIEYTDYERDNHSLKTEIKEATCTSYGYNKVYCENCDYETVEIIDKCEHEKIKEETDKVIRIICKNCNTVIEETKIESDDKDSITEDPTTEDTETTEEIEDAIIQTYVLTIDTNDGTHSTKIENIEKNMNVILPNTQRIGYAFEGWYIDNVKVGSSFVYSYNENKTVVAKWVKIELDKPKVINASKTSLTVEPVEGAVGYQVYISGNTKFKPRNSYSSTRTTINVAEMTRKGTYIAIRTVGRDSTGKFVYSAWKYYKY